MRKKLDTRFPAARIKKVMQTDEDIGKIAMAVPLLVSKALELFLQDLCDRTYEITQKKGAKTVNSMHLKQCVQKFNVFDFLKDTVSKVPDLGGSEANVSEDKSATKRRRSPENEKLCIDDESKSATKRRRSPQNEKRCIDIDNESKRISMEDTGDSSRGRARGRGRGRGRPRGKSNRTLEKHSTVKDENFEEHFDENDEENDSSPDKVHLELPNQKSEKKPVRDFDLNIDLNEIGEPTPMEAIAPSEPSPKVTSDLTTPSAIAPCESSAKPTTVAVAPSIALTKRTNLGHEDIPGWSLEDMEKMTNVDPVQLAYSNRGIYEEDEDYDEE